MTQYLQAGIRGFHTHQSHDVSRTHRKPGAWRVILCPGEAIMLKPSIFSPVHTHSYSCAESTFSHHILPAPVTAAPSQFKDSLISRRVESVEYAGVGVRCRLSGYGLSGYGLGLWLFWAAKVAYYGAIFLLFSSS